MCDIPPFYISDDFDENYCLFISEVFNCNNFWLHQLYVVSIYYLLRIFK